MLSKLPKCKYDPNLLIGFDSADDAAVYKVSDDIGVIQTVDFFPPVVDDPYLFGQIAATNALSDVYAMGGTPRLALNLLTFPASMPLEAAGAILEGGAAKVAEAGAVVAGGHSIAFSCRLSHNRGSNGRGGFVERLLDVKPCV